MPLADELERLSALRQQGALTEDEFQQAKTRLLQGPELSGALSQVNRLRRSKGDRWVGGVCGGVAHLTDIESWVWRLAFVLLALFWGSGFLLYILLWIFVPDE